MPADPKDTGPIPPPKPRRGRKPKQPPPEADAAPKSKPASGAAKRTAKKTRELALIQSGLTELLSFPAMAAGMAGDQWAVDHFTERGPALADRLTAECERNAQLRAMVLKIVQGQGYMMLVIELGLYAAPPLLHYGILPGAEKIGVPTLPGAQKGPQRPPGPPRAPRQPQGAPPPPQPPPAPPEAEQAPEREAWEVAEEAARMNGEIGEDDLGYTSPTEPPPVEFA